MCPLVKLIPIYFDRCDWLASFTKLKRDATTAGHHQNRWAGYCIAAALDFEVGCCAALVDYSLVAALAGSVLAVAVVEIADHLVEHYLASA